MVNFKNMIFFKLNLDIALIINNLSTTTVSKRENSYNHDFTNRVLENCSFKYGGIFLFRFF